MNKFCQLPGLLLLPEHLLPLFWQLVKVCDGHDLESVNAAIASLKEFVNSIATVSVPAGLLAQALEAPCQSSQNEASHQKS